MGTPGRNLGRFVASRLPGIANILSGIRSKAGTVLISTTDRIA